MSLLWLGREKGKQPDLGHRGETEGQRSPLSQGLGTTLTSPILTYFPPFSLSLFSLPDKRPTTSSSFTGFQPPPLARRDSSLKRLTRWGSQGNRTLSANSSEQKSLNGGDETPILALAPQEEKLDPAPEN